MMKLEEESLTKLISSKYPTLIPDRYDYLEDFINEHIKVDDLFNALSDKYKAGYFLDRFSTQIIYQNPKKQADFDSSLSRYYDEDKYINFLKYLYEKNNHECAIDCLVFSNNNLDIKYEKLLFGIERNLDQKDKLLYLHQFCTYHNKESIYYKINDFQLLEMFVKLVLREYEKCNFYFKNPQILIMSCYDLSLPIFFKNKKDIAMYEKIANECGLFLRKIDE